MANELHRHCEEFFDEAILFVIWEIAASGICPSRNDIGGRLGRFHRLISCIWRMDFYNYRDI